MSTERLRELVKELRVSNGNTHERTLLSMAPLLTQMYEGTLIHVNDELVFIEFEMEGRRELRQFDRQKLGPEKLRPGDLVHLRCEMCLAPPSQPLSDDEVQQWERRHAAWSRAQAKTKWAESLLEEEE